MCFHEVASSVRDVESAEGIGRVSVPPLRASEGREAFLRVLIREKERA